MRQSKFFRFVDLYYKIKVNHERYYPQNNCGITNRDFRFLLSCGIIVDGRKGGFVKGPMHIEGGIPIIDKISENYYTLSAEMEGFEYLLSKSITYSDGDTISQYNRFILNDLHFTKYDIDKRIKTINCEPIFINDIMFNKFIYMETGQSIINKHATRKYLITINKFYESHKLFTRIKKLFE